MTFRHITIGFFFASSLLLLGCSNTRVVQPLYKGQWQLIGGVGGPLVTSSSGATQPVALSHLGAAYGLTPKTTIYSSIGISSAIRDIYQLDAGFSYEIIPPYNYQPGISISPAINFFHDKETQTNRFFPQLDINAYWPTYFRNDYVYVGMSNWFEPAQKRAHNLKQETHWIPSLHTGYAFQTEKYGLNLELKYIAPNKDNRNLLIEYAGVNNNGALAVFVAISRKFN